MVLAINVHSARLTLETEFALVDSRPVPHFAPQNFGLPGQDPRDPVESRAQEGAPLPAIGFVVVPRNVNDVILDILGGHVPRAVRQADAPALPNGVEPVPPVRA